MAEHRDTCRKGSKIFYEYLDAGWIKDPSVTGTTNIDLGSPSEKVSAMKERYKLQTEKLENYKWVREFARDELIAEKIVEAINNIAPLEVPEYIPKSYDSGKTYALCYGDPHYGVEFSIKGLFGETINEYSPEIFEKRMWDLRDRIYELVNKENITTLNVFDFGDDIDGCLRVSQLFKLRYGVVDSTIKYAAFISNWLNELTKFVNVNFQMVVDGNHSQLRMLGQPKNTFKDDNMSKVIAAFIREHLSKNPNFSFIQNPTGLIFDRLSNYNIVGIHGEVKNMESTLREMSKTYGVDINYLIGGHIHHKKGEEIAMDTEVINLPSIMGMDDYSLSLNKSAHAAAKLMCFEKGCGKAIDYYIKLN